jgi:hypothetical protein
MSVWRRTKILKIGRFQGKAMDVIQLPGFIQLSPPAGYELFSFRSRAAMIRHLPECKQDHQSHM